MKNRVGVVKPTLVFYGVAVLLIGGSLVALFQLLQRFERERESAVERLRLVFSDRSLLNTPDNRELRFAEIEDLVRKYESDGRAGVQSMFRRISVSKIVGLQERVIYPFYAAALYPKSAVRPPPPEARDLATTPARYYEYPLPGAPPAGVRRLELRSEGQLLGYLYVLIDESGVITVRLVIASLSVLLVAAVIFLILQFRRQERVISRTTVELEEKRRELVRLERLALAGQLSANVFHDLKKPVLNIKNEIEEIGLTVAAGTTGEPVTDGISAGSGEFPVRRIREQVDLFFGILRESSLERFVRSEGEQEFVGLNELIDRSLALVRYERGGVEVRCNYDVHLPSILAEPVRLVQVFSNLILNAYQAMRGQGVLDIRTYTLDASDVTVEIRDTGPGIPPADSEKIFLPFFTTKAGQSGTGLGLYITRDIIRELGGHIEVQSQPGDTLFRIRLPIPQNT